MAPNKLTVPRPDIKDRQFVKPLLCGPGPSDLYPSVIKALSNPVISPMCEEYWEVVRDIRIGLKYVFQTNSDFVLAMSGSGHAGMEAVITNLLAPGQTILIAARGVWDMRAANIAHRHGCKVEETKVKAGETFSLDQLENAIRQIKPAAVFITHADSSTGTIQRLEGLGDICHKNKVLLLVDVVMSVASVPFYMDAWGVDAAYGSAQKGLSGPAGICGIAFSKRAEEVMRKRDHLPPFYLDCLELSGNWNCFGETRSYHHTLSPPLLWALRACLQEVCKETLEKSWNRHSTVQKYFHKRLEDLKFGLFVQKPEDRLQAMTTVALSKQLDYLQFVTYMRKRHNIAIVPGLGPSAGKSLRIGHAGVNATIEIIDMIIDAMDDTRRVLTEESLKTNSLIISDIRKCVIVPTMK